MGKIIPLQGQRFGRLEAISIATPPGARIVKWLCRCDCGRMVNVVSRQLRDGVTQSCGCLRREMVGARNLSHGKTETREYRSWQHAKGRCFNPGDAGYAHYGGRGITMCDRWKDSFEAFLADMGPCPPCHSLDRVNVHGNYEPENCRWATFAEQSRTRTDNIIVEWDGERLILTDLAARLGLRREYLAYLYRQGMDLPEAVEKTRTHIPVRRNRDYRRKK